MIDPRHPNFTRLPGSSRSPRPSHQPPAALGPPLVQIASVARGRASTLPDTLRALQDQTLVRWRWVIVDETDGSARARDVIARLADEPRVTVLSAGATDTRPALALATDGDAPYLAFIRPGDLLEPTTLETWAWALATTQDTVAVTSGAVHFGAAQGIDRVRPSGSGGHVVDERPPSALLVTRAAYHAAGGIDARWGAHEDIEGLACTLAAQGHHVGTLPAHHVWRRVASLTDPRSTRFDRLPEVSLRRRPFSPPTFPDDPPFENPLDGDGPGVLFVLPFMFQGGAERASLDQAAVMAARGWRVTIVALGRVDHLWRSAFCAVTGDVHVAHEMSVAWGDWDRTAPDIPRILSYFLASRRIDAMVLGGTMSGYGVVPWLRGRHPRVAFAAVRHATDWPLLSLEVTRLLDAILVSTQTLADGHRELGIPADRVHRIVTGVDTHRWRPDRERRATLRRWLALPDEALVLVYTSRLSPDKQPLVFAETLARLRARGLDVHAIVTGNGSERMALETRLGELGLSDRVRLLGEVEERLLPSLVACADVAFLPSQREGIALSLLEAMASGLPFVGTAASSQGEVITPGVGALVARGTPAEEAEAYTDALTCILSDRAELAAMGVRARARIDEAWSHTRMGEQLDAALGAAITHARTRSRADDVETLARCAAAVATHAVCVDIIARLSDAGLHLTRVLERLGYDTEGRPLAPDDRAGH